MKQISFCASCQGEIDADAGWCQHCGARQAAGEAPKPYVPPPVSAPRQPAVKPTRPPRRRAASRGKMSPGFGSGFNTGLGLGVGALLVVFGLPIALFVMCSDRDSGSGGTIVEQDDASTLTLDDEIKVKDLLITVHSPMLGKVPLTADLMGDPQVSVEDMLSLDLTVKNTSSTRLYDYRPLGGEWLAIGRRASLKDNFGNEYKRIHFGIVTEVQGVAKRGTLRPGAQIDDVLVFEAPIHRAETLYLTVPLEHMGIETDLEISFNVREIEMR